MNDNKLKCPSCGTLNEPGSGFCGDCGMSLEGAKTVSVPAAPAAGAAGANTPAAATPTAFVPPTPSGSGEVPAAVAPAGGGAAALGKAVKAIPKKTLLIIAAAAALVVVVVLVIIIAANAGGANYIKDTAFPYINYVTGDSQAVLTGFGKNALPIDKDKDTSPSSYTARNGEGIVVIVKDGGDNLLHYITKSSAVTIDEKHISKAAISPDGNAFVYLFGSDSYDDEATLAIYKNGKSEILSEDVYLGTPLSISPNGSAVTWIEKFDDEDGSYTTFMYVNGEVEEIGKTLYVYAVADNGKYVYYEDNENIYVQKGFDEGTRMKVAAAKEGSSVTATLNSDYSQAVFEVKDGDQKRSYFSENAKEPIKMANDNISPIVPHYSVAKNLKKCVYINNAGYGSYTVYALDDDLQAFEIADDVQNYRLSDKGDILYYIQSEELYRMEIDGKDFEDEKLASDVVSFSISDDGKTVYYTTTDDELYVIDGKNKAKSVTYEFDAYSVYNDVVYYIDGTEVYKGAKDKGKLIGEIDADTDDFNSDNVYITALPNGWIEIYIFGDGQIIYSFISSDEKTFSDVTDI
jgi:hypothetical protein